MVKVQLEIWNTTVNVGKMKRLSEEAEVWKKKCICRAEEATGIEH
jgi:hypothetical protein